MPSTSSNNYLFDNQATEAGQRFDALSRLFDSVTFRHLEALGVGPGWRCWEVGAGGPTVANWLISKVGPRGQVLATDINTAWIDDRLDASVEVEQHDVTGGRLPGYRFDLVHARLVLSHLPARAAALELMMSTQRPGGWLLVEDFDNVMPHSCVDPHLPEHQRANKVHAAIRELLIQRGADLEYARTLPRLFRQAGLRGVGADAFFPVALPAATALAMANVLQVRDALMSGGLLTQDEVDGHLQALQEGTIDLGTMPLVSTWGQHI